MSRAKDGDLVTVHYTGKLMDGRVFDSSKGREPLEFTIGEGMVIPGFEKAVKGLAPGEARTVSLPCSEAYGHHNPKKVLQLEKQLLPGEASLQAGQAVEIEFADGQRAVVIVLSVEGDTVTVDTNNPLAGRDLTFEVELLKIG